jgi:Ribose/xylose/arabinose/galactoside ABC-type transport systems, permease components
MGAIFGGGGYGRLLRSILPFIGLVFIIVFFQVTTDQRLLSPRNLRTIFNQAFLTMLGACGVSFVVAQGNLDFSLGAIVGTAACFGALTSNMGFAASLVAAVAVGALIGLLNGSIHAGFGVSGTIVTLCSQFVFRGVTSILGSNGLFLPLSWAWLDSLEVKLAVAAAVLVLSYLAFEFTRLGKYSKAIGSSGPAALQSGVSLGSMRVLAYVISGSVAGLCGFFSLVRAGSVASTTGTSYEMNVLLAVVLGGMPLSGGAASKMRSAFVGSLMLAFLANGLIIWGVNDSVQQGVKGVILLAAVALSFERSNVDVIK